MGDLGYRLNFNLNPKDRKDRKDRAKDRGGSRNSGRRKRSGGGGGGGVGGGGGEEEDEGAADELRLCQTLIEDKDWKSLQERDQLLAGR